MLSKLFTVSLLIIAIIFLCGCIGTIPTQNNTSSTPTLFPISQRPNIETSSTLPVYGHVYSDNNIVSKANVFAFSNDGEDSLSTITNESGSYILYIKPDMDYKIVVTYGESQHSIWPVYRHNLADGKNVYNDIIDMYDVNLSPINNSAITGNTGGWKYISIDARPVNDSSPITAISDRHGNYSITIKPGVRYALDGKDYYGQVMFIINFHYRNKNYFIHEVTADENETVLVDADVRRST
ncbi:MAG TPA: hypothetical protein VGJ92_11605 [Methanocella sp.]|jgi:hypothetical protein